VARVKVIAVLLGRGAFNRIHTSNRTCLLAQSLAQFDV
jgi:hypothetical protein